VVKGEQDFHSRIQNQRGSLIMICTSRQIISAFRESGNGGDSALGARVSKTRKSDKWQRVCVRDRKWLSGQVACPCQIGRVKPVDHFGVRRSKDWKPCIWIRETAKSKILKRQKVPLWDQHLITCRNSAFHHFQGQGIGVLCSEIPENREMR
jgi:hypothetical protein